MRSGGCWTALAFSLLKGEFILSLRTSSVNQCLEKRLLILGFEVPELLAIFLLLSILNFIFPPGFKLFCVWLPTSIVGVILRFGKRGKPDNYLIHLARYHTLPSILSCFKDSTQWARLPRTTKNLRGHT